MENGNQAVQIIYADQFSPVDELDGPFEGEDLTCPSPAVALRFAYDSDLVALVKSILRRVRHSCSGRGRPLSKIPLAGDWSKPSKCWWVRSSHWPEVRNQLLAAGVKLEGKVAHPGRRKIGFFKDPQVWDVRACNWR